MKQSQKIFIICMAVVLLSVFLSDWYIKNQNTRYNLMSPVSPYPSDSEILKIQSETIYTDTSIYCNQSNQVITDRGIKENTKKILNKNNTPRSSWYGHLSCEKIFADGQPFDNKIMACAHNGYPFGTKLKVTNIKNKKSVVVIVKDRGNFGKGKKYTDRDIDLTRSAFKKIADLDDGIVDVSIEVIKLGKGDTYHHIYKTYR